MISRYIIFYLATAFLFALYSYLLDIILNYVEYRKYLFYEVNGFVYFAYFIVRLHLIGIICVTCYNIVINDTIKKVNRLTRYIIAVVFGIIYATISKEFLFAHYRSNYEWERAFILWILIFASLEALRDLKIYYKYTKRSRKWGLFP